MDAEIGPARPVVVETDVRAGAVGGDVGAHHVVVGSRFVHLDALGRQVEIKGGFELVRVGNHR